MNKHEIDCLAVLVQAVKDGRIHSVVLQAGAVVVCQHGTMDKHTGRSFSDAAAQAAQAIMSDQEAPREQG